jgi:hypothetical protein
MGLREWLGIMVALPVSYIGTEFLDHDVSLQFAVSVTLLSAFLGNCLGRIADRI